MENNFKFLLEETNVISLRTASVMDDGNLVQLRLTPAFRVSSVPRKITGAPKDFDYVTRDFAYLYRHALSEVGAKTDNTDNLPKLEDWIKPMNFHKPPALKFIWADSGNSLAVLLDDEPWAFIDERTQTGHSKGLIKPAVGAMEIGNQWDQALFERLFPD